MLTLHLSDRLSERGGAYRYLLDSLGEDAARGGAHLGVGAVEPGVSAPCPVTVVSGLDARAREPVALEALVRELRPRRLHVHTVMNPEALEWVGRAEGVERVLSVQDHRVFCPGKGKWTADGRVCRDRMSRDACADCFEDEAYLDEMLELTEARRRALAAFEVRVLSDYMKGELSLPEGQVRVVHPKVTGLDPEAEPDGPPCVLFAGRLVAAKGVRETVEVWRSSGVDLPLVFAGTGPLREELAAVPGVEVLGWVPHRRMARVYRRARALILTPRWQEPFGIAGLEASTLGVPVVAWESGGLAEWHPGPLAEWGDVAAAAALLREAVSRPDGFRAS